ncbi:winged helix-turn-helix domain-containing protein [Tenggerimyces flavus]|uniref:Winged helix-turn-helix domain-containing protein n=1 Tax=Tenggerimyces flavus TaxID=1708749 RepID=A0ABV7Y1U7_9ACTN|nr:winged helix-turn-helix domain-containing protein [Tenggerimyces flavus]MBM7790922.1 DNA-binding response OmpR family regulator [Tenggerimyces flavus]
MYSDILDGAAEFADAAPALILCVGTTADQCTAVLRSVGPDAVVMMAADAGAALRVLQNARSSTATPAPTVVSRPVEFGPLLIDSSLREATWRGRALDLSTRDFDLLATLVSDGGRVWTFADLTEAVWRRPYLGDVEAVVSAVKRLRRRLTSVTGELVVASIRGVGYRLSLLPTPLRQSAV